MTCVGNSGPLPEIVAKTVEEVSCKPVRTGWNQSDVSNQNNLVVAGVLSANRNFEGRVHPLTRANYLMSPMLVVAFALADRIDIDFLTEPLGETLILLLFSSKVSRSLY